MRSVEHGCPRIDALAGVDSVCKARDKVQAYSVVLVAMDASFALFHVDRIAGQIPVHDAVAVRVEIDLLPFESAFFS
jgi:hypothetical protein